MKLIVGLGNPGKKYEHTRHNAGFAALDFYLRDSQPKWERKFDSLFCQTHPGHDERVIWLKPETFMNESGRAVREALEFYKIDPGHDLLVIHDDVDLPVGTVRETDDSSSAGHKGVQNIIEELSTQKFHRIRVGIENRGADDPVETEAYVLQNFTEEETEKLNEILIEVRDKIEDFLQI